MSSGDFLKEVMIYSGEASGEPEDWNQMLDQVIAEIHRGLEHGFTPREIDDQSGIGTQFVVMDFNGDGKLDIVTANKKGVFLLEQNPATK